MSTESQPNALGSTSLKPASAVSIASDTRKNGRHIVPEDGYKYTPETAFEAGAHLVDHIKGTILASPDIGDELCKEVWAKELECLASQKVPPPTFIAICGPTGAGKSTLVNAILGHAIVPTSALGACTSVVTEISYKTGSSIEGEITFLERSEWKEELEGLIEDLNDSGDVNKDSTLKKTSPLSIEKAKKKVEAVYPNVPLAQIIKMSADEVIGHDDVVASALGTTRNISAADPEKFGELVAEYIDADHKHKEVPGSQLQTPDTRWWPLIKRVQVRCCAKALSTGAVLVDLPGIADTNVVRSHIAREYMKNCKHTWIVTSIKRASDDVNTRDLVEESIKNQLYMDGKYNAGALTFIATASDDVSPQEVIPRMDRLQCSEFSSIEMEVDLIQKMTLDQEEKRIQVEAKARILRKELEDKKAVLLACMPAKRRRQPKSDVKAGKKRKVIAGCGGSGDDGLRRSQHRASDEDEAMDWDIIQDDRSREIDDDDDEEMRETGHTNSLPRNLEATKAEVDALQTLLANRERDLERIELEILKLGKSLNSAMCLMKVFCANVRNKIARDLLEKEFHSTLAELDEDKGPRRKPEESIRSNARKDYDDIAVRAFTVSPRDYIYLKLARVGDKTACFSNVDETGIPALQEWCRQLTLPSREQSAWNFMLQLQTLGNSVQAYLNSDMNIAVQSAALRQRWASTSQNPGVAKTLEKEILSLRQEAVGRLQENFRVNLAVNLRIGSELAHAAGDKTLTDIAYGLRWNTYRATLRRDGVFAQEDLNKRLCLPVTSTILRSWAHVFQQDLFAQFKQQAISAIERLLSEVEQAIPHNLRPRYHAQAEIARGDVRMALDRMVALAQETVQSEQKDISRSLIPYVQAELRPAYDEAKVISGTGSRDLQLQVMTNFFKDNGKSLFDRGIERMLTKLNAIAVSAGNALDLSLPEIGRKVEVAMSVLWANTCCTPAQEGAYRQAVDVMEEAMGEIDAWMHAQQSARGLEF